MKKLTDNSKALSSKIIKQLFKTGDFKNFIKLFYTTKIKKGFFGYQLFDDRLAIFLNASDPKGLSFSYDELKISKDEIKRSHKYGYWIDDPQMIHPLKIDIDVLKINLSNNLDNSELSIIVTSDHDKKPLDNIFTELNKPSRFSLGIDLSEFGITDKNYSKNMIMLTRNNSVEYINATNFIREIKNGQNSNYLFKVRKFYNRDSDIEKDDMFGLEFIKKQEKE